MVEVQRWRIGIAVALSLGVAHLALAKAERSAAFDVVEETLTRVFAILAERDSSEEDRLRRVEQIAFSQFDFEIMSRLVLYRNWKRLSPEQKTEFIAEFKKLLSRSYGVRLDRFGKEKVEMVGEQPEPRGDMTIKTRIVGGEFSGSQITFRMREFDDAWRAIDVSIEGISLVANYRSQFADVINKDGPDGLLARMREKNESPDSGAGSEDFSEAASDGSPESAGETQPAETDSGESG